MNAQPVPWPCFRILSRFPTLGYGTLAPFPFKSTDHGAQMIGSGTSENHHRVCSQLWMHHQSSSTHNAEKIDPNAKSRHILKEYLLHEKATLSLSYFAMHTQWLLFTMSTQTANSKAHVLHYLCKLQLITSTFRVIPYKFSTNIDHVLNLSQAVLGNILIFLIFMRVSEGKT